MLGEGGEAKLGTNVNYLTEEFGIMVNSDCVVRTVYYKYLHPKVGSFVWRQQYAAAKICAFSAFRRCLSPMAS